MNYDILDKIDFEPNKIAQLFFDISLLLRWIFNH